MTPPFALPLKTDPDFDHQYILNANGTIIADCAIFGRGAPTHDACTANANYIVTAVNAHAGLVAALKMVRDADNDCISDNLPTMPTMARAKIDAALAAAEPKES